MHSIEVLENWKFAVIRFLYSNEIIVPKFNGNGLVTCQVARFRERTFLVNRV